jgi:hypothetical protein
MLVSERRLLMMEKRRLQMSILAPGPYVAGRGGCRAGWWMVALCVMMGFLDGLAGQTVLSRKRESEAEAWLRVESADMVRAQDKPDLGDL